MMKPLFRLAFAFNAVLTLAGFALLLESPYTGLRLGACSDGVCVNSVEPDGSAYGKLQPGDVVLRFDGASPSSLAFHEDPDYIRSARDQVTFWAAAKELDRLVVKGRPLRIDFNRAGQAGTVTITPESFPLGRALWRAMPIYLVGWTFLIVAFLVYRKKQIESAVVFSWVGMLVCVNWATGTPFTVRDLSFSYPAFAFFSRLDTISALLLIAAFVHLSLVFPRRVLPPALHRPVVLSLYGTAVVLLLSRLLGLLNDTYLASYTAFTAALVLAIVGFTAQYWREKSPAVRRQVKWVLFSAVASSAIYTLLSAFPAALGSGFVSVALSGLAFILIPLSFAFAITRRRLLEIENILDNAVVYGFTVAVLAVVESALLGWFAPRFTVGENELPYFSVAAVLLVVFIYLPVRNTIRRVVERLFGRGDYNIEHEIQRFHLECGISDGRSPVERFVAYVQELLSPESVVVLRIGQGQAPRLDGQSATPPPEAEFLLSHGEAIWARLRHRAGCVFGYEVPDHVSSAPFPAGLENALFLPLISDAGGVTRGRLAVLMQKRSGLGYSAKDVTLLNALAANLAGVIAADELRQERDLLEARFAREKDAVVKELHDGLGSILTSVIISAQVAEKHCVTAPEAAELVRRIEDFSIEAVDFMRTGLTVLDQPQADLGSVMRAVNDRYVKHFAAAGIALRIDVAPEAAALRLGAAVMLNLTRINQEALGNVIKHAGASRAEVRLEISGEALEMTISDSGTGLLDGGQAAGRGLANLRRRIEALGGAMNMLPASGHGVVLRFLLPLRPAEVG